jgi:hypothetical protein
MIMPIRNSQELAASQQWLNTMERILEELRQTVLPKSPELYQVMSERYVEEIVKVQREINDYLDIKAEEELEVVEVG